MTDISDLLDRYWQLAYAEGRENRQHDTESGDAQECRASIDEAIMLLNDRIEELENRLCCDPGGSDKIDELESAIGHFRFQLTEAETSLAEARADALEEIARIFESNGARGVWAASAVAQTIRALKSGGANG